MSCRYCDGLPFYIELQPLDQMILEVRVILQVYSQAIRYSPGNWLHKMDKQLLVRCQDAEIHEHAMRVANVEDATRVRAITKMGPGSAIPCADPRIGPTEEEIKKAFPFFIDSTNPPYRTEEP